MVNETGGGEKKQSTRNTVIIAVTLAAILLAGYVIWNFVRSDQPQIVNTIQGSPSEKETTMKAEANQAKTGQTRSGDDIVPPLKKP